MSIPMVKMKGIGNVIEKSVRGRNTLDGRISQIALNKDSRFKGSFPPAKPNENQLRQFVKSADEIKAWNRAVLKAREEFADPLRK